MRRITRCSTCGNVFLANAVLVPDHGAGSRSRCSRCREDRATGVVGRTARSVRRLGSPETLLIVDDDPSIRHLVTVVIDDLSLEVVEAHDYDSAVEMAQRHSPDLVICDSAVPGAGREEVGAALRRLLPDAQILSFSGTTADRPWADDVAIKGSDSALEKLRTSLARRSA